MSTSFNAAEFTERVYDVVRMVPRGRVTTYGHVAKLAGYPGYARAVGTALKSLQYDPSAYAVNLDGDVAEYPGDMEGDDAPLPWQRILSSGGWIAERGPADGGVGAKRQAAVLRAEGVEIDEPRGGGISTTRGSRLKVSLYGPEGYGWFPSSVQTPASSEQGETRDSPPPTTAPSRIRVSRSSAEIPGIAPDAAPPLEAQSVDDPAGAPREAIATPPLASAHVSAPRRRRPISRQPEEPELNLRRSKRLRSRQSPG